MATDAGPSSEKITSNVTSTPVDGASTPTTTTNMPSLKDDADTNGTPAAKDGLFARVSTFFGDWFYFWEVLGLVLSAAAIVSICIVVGYFDEKPPPVWSTNINIPTRETQSVSLTINSLLAILATLGSTCAMIPVTKGLGQLKYVWFIQQDRKLADLEMFDSASRGVLGSAQLVWKLRLKHLAVFGGLASLLVLAYGPFVQNLIFINIEYHPSNETSQISYVSEISHANASGILASGAPTRYMIASALSDDSDEWVVPPHNCPTGECDWEGYYTLAACTRCTDISDRLTRKCTPYKEAGIDPENGEFPASGGCEVSLPNGLSTFNIDVPTYDPAYNPGRNIMVMNTTLEPFIYTDLKGHFVTVQIILGLDPNQPASSFANNTRQLSRYRITEDSPLIARECAIIPCVQNQSFFLTSKPDSSILEPEIDVLREWTNFKWDPLAGQALVDFPGGNITYDDQTAAQRLLSHYPYFGGDWYRDIRDWLGLHLTAFTFGNSPEQTDWAMTVTRSRLPEGQDYDSTLASIMNNTHTGRWRNSYCLLADNSTRPDVECGMHKLAAGITNAMRTAAWEVPRNARKIAEGQSYSPQQICHAQWQYISAPVVVWILALVLFIGVVVKTRRAKIKAWRTSPLATLLLRLDPDSREHLKDWQRMGDAELRETAEQLKLRLKVDGDEPPRFVKE
ncbi:hypothetical protein F5X68DRAFT_275074 [Plectosphaerella plurivora]|uniref:Uncharacterized protein n=1 Tax=Plectosphaerella plurivora TaxID=936078 RepID=A0A9P8VF88_9PEZI|nr:hypothetical protein F5X68DRAFT_275074 [Plectosphaerella plurivora]